MSVVEDYLLPIKQNNELFRKQLNSILSDAYNRIGNIYTPEQVGAEGDPTVNDTDAFNELQEYIPSTGGILQLPRDYYVKAWDITKPLIIMGPGRLRNYDTVDTTSANYIVGVKSNDVTFWHAGVKGAISTTATTPATYASILVFADGSDNPYERFRLLDSTVEGGQRTLELSEAKDHWINKSRIIGGWDYGVLGPVACDRVFFTENVVMDTRNNAGFRMGSLTDAEACRDLMVALNHFENCGYGTPQDAVDISTSVAERIRVLINTIKNCGNGVELKVDTPNSGYNDSSIIGNMLFTDQAAMRAFIRVQFSGALDQDHVNRIRVCRNEIHAKAGSGGGGILCDAHNDIDLSDNDIDVPDIPIRLDVVAGGTMRRLKATGNKTRGVYGVYISGGAGAVIEEPDFTGNDMVASTTCLFMAETAGVGVTMTDPNITGNPCRATGTSPAMQLSGLDGGLISGNPIRSGGKGIVFSGSMTNGEVTVTNNPILATSDAIQVNSASGTFQIHDNPAKSVNGRGVLDSAAGATVLAGGNCRGVWDTSIAAAPNVAGGLGDFFWNPAPAAGATKWVCTTAGAAGVAVWTAQ